MRIYTLDEARALLPQVAPVVIAIQRAYRELRALQASLGQAAEMASADGNLTANPWDEAGAPRQEALAAAVRDGAAKLDIWGIELKDPDRGLIDFYWLRGGETVYLCWLAGERELAFWHSLRDGFAGRRPISEPGEPR